MKKMSAWTKAAGVSLTAALLTGPVDAQTRRTSQEQNQENQVETQRSRNRLTGQVAARDTDAWHMWLEAGRHEVVVEGDGRTDLDLYIDGASGRRLAMDDDETDQCSATFYLRRSGYVEIRIRNLGRTYNEYWLRVR